MYTYLKQNKTLISLKTSFVGTKMDINDANEKKTYASAQCGIYLRDIYIYICANIYI